MYTCIQVPVVVLMSVAVETRVSVGVCSFREKEANYAKRIPIMQLSCSVKDIINFLCIQVSTSGSWLRFSIDGRWSPFFWFPAMIRSRTRSSINGLSWTLQQHALTSKLELHSCCSAFQCKSTQGNMARKTRHLGPARRCFRGIRWPLTYWFDGLIVDNNSPRLI